MESLNGIARTRTADQKRQHLSFLNLMLFGLRTNPTVIVSVFTKMPKCVPQGDAGRSLRWTTDKDVTSRVPSVVGAERRASLVLLIQFTAARFCSKATMFPQLSTMSWRRLIHSNLDMAIYKYKSVNLAELVKTALILLQKC